MNRTILMHRGNMGRIALIASAIWLLSLSCGKAPVQENAYETFIDSSASVLHFQGSYLVAKGDSILARGSRGMAEISTNRPNTPETKFMLGSLTKSFTAIAVMQLVEKGKIALDQPISAFLPDYPKDVADRVTVDLLLSHRSGIPDPLTNPEFVKRTSSELKPTEIVAFFKDLPLKFDPGERYEYSSSNYILLGLIIEKVTGMPWSDYIEADICRPAGLFNTGVFYDYRDRDDFAIGYGPGRGTGGAVEAPFVHPSVGYAAGALASTVDDLYRLNQALNGTTLLSAESIKKMLTPQSATYGYGWLTVDFGGHRLTAHGGGAPGYVSMLQRWVDDSVCVVVLSNWVAVPAHAIANGLAAIAMNEPYELPHERHPIDLAPDQLKVYEGDYRMSNGEIRSLKLAGYRLLARRGEGPAYPILPEAWDHFYFAHDPMTSLTFLRDSLDNVTAQVLEQAFDRDTAWIVK